MKRTFYLSLASKHGIVAVSQSKRTCSVETVPPNPSLKRTPNGIAVWPSSAGASPHFALAVQHVLPSSPA